MQFEEGDVHGIHKANTGDAEEKKASEIAQIPLGCVSRESAPIWPPLDVTEMPETKPSPSHSNINISLQYTQHEVGTMI